MKQRRARVLYPSKHQAIAAKYYWKKASRELTRPPTSSTITLRRLGNDAGGRLDETRVAAAGSGSGDFRGRDPMRREPHARRPGVTDHYGIARRHSVANRYGIARRHGVIDHYGFA